MQHKITDPKPLLDQDGKIIEPGYSNDLILDYNPENLQVYPFKWLNRLRLKEWDYYGMTTKDFFFSITVSNIGYAGVIFVYFIDFLSKTIQEDTLMIPFAKGCNLPRSSKTGNVLFKHKTTSIQFLKDKEQRIIKVEWPSFNKGEGISAELIMDQPKNHDSIVMVTPIGKNRFYYNQKINAMPTKGTLLKGKQNFDILPDNALTTLDWGRGVWEYSSFWIWGSASGFINNETVFGLNIGKGFGDLSHASENAFFINGTMHKLGYLVADYNPQNFMEPWTFYTDCGRLDLKFIPFFERVAKTNLVLLKSEVHQMFGHYNGTVVCDDGTPIEIKNIIGWAEEHFARW
jgi:hypothetical protein